MEQPVYILENGTRVVTGPTNQVVIPYKEFGYRLLAVRHKEEGFYFDPVDLRELSSLTGFPLPEEFDLSSAEGCLASFATISPLSCEGYVAVDKHGNRVKIKHPGYVALHHRKESPYAPPGNRTYR